MGERRSALSCLSTQFSHTESAIAALAGSAMAHADADDRVYAPCSRQMALPLRREPGSSRNEHGTGRFEERSAARFASPPSSSAAHAHARHKPLASVMGRKMLPVCSHAGQAGFGPTRSATL
jgi:hypothetical protein